jgi:hypothetical protein
MDEKSREMIFGSISTISSKVKTKKHLNGSFFMVKIGVNKPLPFSLSFSCEFLFPLSNLVIANNNKKNLEQKLLLI